MFKNLLYIIVFFAGSLSNLFASTFYAVPTATYQSIFNSGDVRYQAITGRLGVGYGELLNAWAFLAAEIFANPKSIKINDKPVVDSDGQPINDLSLVTKYSYGVSILPGMLLDGMTKAYIRLGLIYTNFENFDQTNRGYQVGLGLDYELSPCWMIRGEYDYIKYGSVDQIPSVRAEEMSLGFVYTFRNR